MKTRYILFGTFRYVNWPYTFIPNLDDLIILENDEKYAVLDREYNTSTNTLSLILSKNRRG